jgi:LPXTG-motif cell wall-anchored protein
MKKTLGILMVMLGAGIFSFSGFNKTSNKVMTDNGQIKDAPVMATSFNWFPLAGAVLFAGGIAVTMSKKKTK